MSTGAIAVVGGGQSAGTDLAAGLVTLGARVCVVTSPDERPSDQSVSSVRWDMSGPEGLRRALTEAEEQVGPIGTMVWAWTEPRSIVPRRLDEVGESAWEDMAVRPIRRYLAFLQAAWAYLGGREGRMVTLIPTLSIVGAPSGLVAWAAAAEGQRALSKVAARNWGTAGITVNCLAVAPERLAWGDPDSPDAGPPGHPLQRNGLPPVSLGRAVTLGTDVASVVSTMAAGGFSSVTGATIGVDGGVWMAP